MLFGNKGSIQAASLLLSFVALTASAQIANYVTNGGFEAKYNCNYPNELNKAKGWNCIGNDTAKFGGFLYAVDCFSNAPNTGVGFQNPRTGSTFFRMTVFCPDPCLPINSRFYPKNRLKRNLVAGRTYCVKMYVSLQDIASRGISNLGFCFVDGSIDSINYPNQPLTYLNPQVVNPTNNIITDITNWNEISGIFTATGNEKYLVLGNFETDLNTSQSPVGTNSVQVWAEYFTDDVSCIDIDLPAFAGRDTSVVTGNTVYIGRPSDVGIDEACTWFQLPDMNTVLATSAGITVNANGTSTYVVRQEICGNIKWDTVVVKEDPLGLEPVNQAQRLYRLFPQPATDKLYIEGPPSSAPVLLEVRNTQGQVLLTHRFSHFTGRATYRLNLEAGIYFIDLKGEQSLGITSKLVIDR